MGSFFGASGSGYPPQFGADVVGGSPKRWVIDAAVEILDNHAAVPSDAYADAMESSPLALSAPSTSAWSTSAGKEADEKWVAASIAKLQAERPGTSDGEARAALILALLPMERSVAFDGQGQSERPRVYGLLHCLLFGSPSDRPEDMMPGWGTVQSWLDGFPGQVRRIGLLRDQLYHLTHRGVETNGSPDLLLRGAWVRSFGYAGVENPRVSLPHHAFRYNGGASRFTSFVRAEQSPLPLPSAAIMLANPAVAVMFAGALHENGRGASLAVRETLSQMAKTLSVSLGEILDQPCSLSPSVTWRDMAVIAAEVSMSASINTRGSHRLKDEVRLASDPWLRSTFRLRRSLVEYASALASGAPSGVSPENEARLARMRRMVRGYSQAWEDVSALRDDMALLRGVPSGSVMESALNNTGLLAHSELPSDLGVRALWAYPLMSPVINLAEDGAFDVWVATAHPCTVPRMAAFGEDVWHTSQTLCRVGNGLVRSPEEGVRCLRWLRHAAETGGAGIGVDSLPCTAGYPSFPARIKLPSAVDWPGISALLNGESVLPSNQRPLPQMVAIFLDEVRKRIAVTEMELFTKGSKSPSPRRLTGFQ